MISQTLVLCLFALSGAYARRSNDCSVRIRGSMSSPTPLILQSGKAELVIPNRYADVVVEAGQTVDLYCSDAFSDFSGHLLQAKCVRGKNFEVNGKTYDFESFRCRSWPTFTAKYTGQTCGANDNAEIISVGFQVSKNRFVEQYEVCFNSAQMTTYWSRYTLGSYSKFYQTRVERMDFKQGDFYDHINVNNYYTQRNQKKNIARALGINVDKYFNSHDYLYLSRGHLAAKADFVYGAGQQASFMFINVAPQWQCINAGNWGDLEIFVRDLANSRRSTFTTYSGVYGVSTLPNKYGKQTPLYLYQNGNKKGIPVPALYYRLIQEQSTGKGVVLVTVNDPYKSLSELKQLGYILCNDVSSQLSYLDGFKTRTNIRAGYTYACTIADFAKKVPELPQINANGGLLN